MRITVLDHGYVEFVEAWGHGQACAPQLKELEDGRGECGYDMETGIIEAARQSTQGSFRGWEQDAKLLAFLHNNKHATPFEFAGMVIEVQAPIFVFREWHRHRTQSYNEMSARYAPLPDLYYLPSLERVTTLGRSDSKQSGTTGAQIDEVGAETFIQAVAVQYARAETVYKAALLAGIPKELARLVMPVGHYSRMRACANLRNWLSFLTLRRDPAAQWEIRRYADAVAEIIEKKFPQTWALFSKATS